MQARRRRRAISAGPGPQTKPAELALIVDRVEDSAAKVPAVGRISHLLVVDILPVGLASKRSAGTAGRRQ